MVGTIAVLTNFWSQSTWYDDRPESTRRAIETAIQAASRQHVLRSPRRWWIVTSTLPSFPPVHKPCSRLHSSLGEARAPFPRCFKTLMLLLSLLHLICFDHYLAVCAAHDLRWCCPTRLSEDPFYFLVCVAVCPTHDRLSKDLAIDRGIGTDQFYHNLVNDCAGWWERPGWDACGGSF